ncbi:hypothetical protein DV738_g3738, partial [Chaetothyriales sp. CBS 135597]
MARWKTLACLGITYHIVMYILGPKSDEPLADTLWADKWPVTPIAPDFFTNFVAGNCTASAELQLAEVVVPTCDRVWGEEVVEEGRPEQEDLVAASFVESEQVAPPQHTNYRPLGGAANPGAKAREMQQTALFRFAWFWCCSVLCSVFFLFGFGIAQDEPWALKGRQSQDHDDSVAAALREARELLRKQTVLARWFRSLGLSMSARMVALALDMESLRSVVNSKDNEIARLVQQANLDKSEIAQLVRDIARLREEQQSAKDAAKLSAVLDMLRADIVAKDGRLLATHQEIAELKSSLEASEAKAAELLASYSARAEEVERVNEELARLQGEYQTKLRALSTAQAAAATVGALRQSIDNLKTQLAIETSRAERAAKELDEVQARYSACYSQVADLNQETKSQKASISFLKGEVDRLKSAANRPQPGGQGQVLQRLQENTRKLQVSNTALQAEVREKNGQLAALRRELAQLRTSNGQLAADLATKAQEKERLEEEVWGLRAAQAATPTMAAAEEQPEPTEEEMQGEQDEIVVCLPPAVEATTEDGKTGDAPAGANQFAQLGYKPSPQTLDPKAPAYVDPAKAVPLCGQRFEDALYGDGSSGTRRTRRGGAMASWTRGWLQAVGNAYPTWYPAPHGDGRPLQGGEVPPSLQALYLAPGVVSSTFAPSLARPLADIPLVPSSARAPTKGSKGGELARSKWAS